MARTTNPARYYLVPYHAYEEGSYVGMQAAIVRGSSSRAVMEAVDMETHEGDFPPELVSAMTTDTFGGSSVERADGLLYYVAGAPEDEEEEESGETPTYIVRYSEPEEFATLDAAQEQALRHYKVYTPKFYAVDRGGLRKVKPRDNPQPTAGSAPSQTATSKAVPSRRRRSIVNPFG